VTGTRPSDLGAVTEVCHLALRGPESQPGLSRLAAETEAHLIEAITRHRVSRLVLDSAEQLGFSAEGIERLKNDTLAHTHAAFQLVGHTIQVSEALTEADIDHLIIKGVALGALSSTPASRGAGDVDVLVEPSDLARLHEVLLGLGLRPAEALPDYSKRWSWTLWTFLDRERTYIGAGMQVDVHWRISSQRHLFPNFPVLWTRRTDVRVADRPIPTLGVPDSLFASCFHTYFDQFQPLRSLLDVVALLRTLDPTTPLPRPGRQLGRLVAGVVTLVTEVFPGVVDEQASRVLEQLPPPSQIVRQRWREALLSPKTVWEESQDLRALARKARAEARFDHPLEVLPRFIGKRLAYFPPATVARPSITLGEAFFGRMRVESARKQGNRRKRSG
jgi:hypothetical protein